MSMNINKICAIKVKVSELNIIIVYLDNGRSVSFCYLDYENLKRGSYEQLNNVRIMVGGLALKWVDLDEFILVSTLIIKYGYDKQ